MSRRQLRVEQALELLPDLEELAPLRDALIGASGEDEARTWASSETYATLDTRLADPARLEAELPAVVARVTERVESVYRQVIVAMRALEAGSPAEASAALAAAGEVEEGAGRLEAAERFYERAVGIGRRARDRRPEGLALRRLARVARARGELALSLERYRRGFEIAEAQRDPEGMVVACQGAGNVLAQTGRWAASEEWYARGLALVGEAAPSRLLWQLESNLSAVTRRAGRLDDSERWLRRARATVERLGDAAGRVYVSNAEGLLAMARGDAAVAEAAYRAALAEGGSPAETAPVLVNLADALLALGRVAEAEVVTRRLERIAVAHGLVASLPYAYRALGAVARARRDEDGFVFYEQALELCRGPEVPELELALTQLEYAEFDRALDRPEPARARLLEARAVLERLGTAPELARVDASLAALDAPRADSELNPEPTESGG